MILRRILLAGGVCLRHTCMPCNNKKFSIVIVKIRVVIHCNAVDKKVHHDRLNNKSMVVVNTKCVICNDAYKNSESKICQSHL